MKRISIVFALLISLIVYAQRPFIGKWETTDGKIILPTRGDFDYTYQKENDPSITGSGKGTYAKNVIDVSEAGAYIISITPKISLAFDYGKSNVLPSERAQFKELKQWGDVVWMMVISGSFSGCSELKVTATDVPNLSEVNFMLEMFKNCTSITEIPNLNQWNLSTVRNMNFMFEGASSFNQDISQLNVSNAKEMNGLLKGATAFNQNLGSWIIKGGALLNDIFSDSGMDCVNYSNTLKGWAGNPKMGKFVRLSSNIKYDKSAATSRKNLIDTKGWYISDDIEVSDCAPVALPFSGVWQATADGKITLPTDGADFTYEYKKIGDDTKTGSGSGSKGKTIIDTGDSGEYLITITPSDGFAFFYGDKDITQEIRAQFKELRQWGGGKWLSNLASSFSGCSNLKITATDIPNFSAVTNMNHMFKDCSSIETIPNIYLWDVGSVTSLAGMFKGAEKFNTALSNWNVGEVSSMNSMFEGATKFNQDISSWVVSEVTDMESMFSGAAAFNQDISGWDVSKVSDMQYMFSNATAFNQNLGAWLIKEDDASLTDIFTNSGMDCTNYSNTLKGWAENPNIGQYVSLSSNRKYGVGAEVYRDKLMNDKKWSISGDTFDPSCNPGLSTEDITRAKTKIFVLNPVKDHLHIQGLSGITSIEVYNLSGQLVKILFHTDRDLTDLTKGTYILKINTPNVSITEKIIVGFQLMAISYQPEAKSQKGCLYNKDSLFYW